MGIFKLNAFSVDGGMLPRIPQASHKCPCKEEIDTFSGLDPASFLTQSFSVLQTLPQVAFVHVVPVLLSTVFLVAKEDPPPLFHQGENCLDPTQDVFIKNFDLIGRCPGKALCCSRTLISVTES